MVVIGCGNGRTGNYWGKSIAWGMGGRTGAEGSSSIFH